MKPGSFFVEIMSQDAACFEMLSGVYGFVNRNFEAGACSGTNNVIKSRKAEYSRKPKA